MDETFAVILATPDRHQAVLVKNLLGQHDIDALLDNEAPDVLHGGTGGQVTGGVFGIEASETRVLVRDDDAQRARDILKQAAESLASGMSSPALAALESGMDHDDEPWPACPRCQQRRLTTCPVCETSGTNFPQAFLPDDEQIVRVIERSRDAEADDDDQTLFLLCPTCDEPFVPRFPAVCEWCGHRFDDGWERPESPTPDREALDINVRVLATIAGLIITIVALFAFFANLASSR